MSALKCAIFMRVRVDSASVGGFSGLAPPRVTLKLTITKAVDEPVAVGDWAVTFTAHAKLLLDYWSRQLRSSKQDLEDAERVGDVASMEPPSAESP